MAKEHGKETQEQQRKGGNGERDVARRENAPQATAMSVANPFTFMRRFADDLNRLFGFGLGPNLMPGSEETMWMPAVEVAEEDGQLVIRADVPGLNKDQINVEVEDGQLVISGERRQEHEERHARRYRSERHYGSFYRAIPLPEGVNPEQVKATFTNGVLEITIPVSEQAHHGRRVEIQEGARTKQPTQQSEAHSA